MISKLIESPTRPSLGVGHSTSATGTAQTTAQSQWSEAVAGQQTAGSTALPDRQLIAQSLNEGMSFTRQFLEKPIFNPSSGGLFKSPSIQVPKLPLVNPHTVLTGMLSAQLENFRNAKISHTDLMNTVKFVEAALARDHRALQQNPLSLSWLFNNQTQTQQWLNNLFSTRPEHKALVELKSLLIEVKREEKPRGSDQGWSVVNFLKQNRTPQSSYRDLKGSIDESRKLINRHSHHWSQEAWNNIAGPDGQMAASIRRLHEMSRTALLWKVFATGCASI